MSRDFKGIWIPREIWLHPELLPLEMMLWAEIHSLYSREHKGCFATNDYLAEKFHVSERYIREMISKLKALNLIVEVSFNGRVRVIRARMPEEDFESEEEFQADRNCSSGQGGTAVPGRQEPQFRPTYKEYTSRVNKNNNTPPNPKKGETPDGVKPAKAGRVCESFGSHVKLTKEEHKDLIDAHGEATISSIIEEMNDYCLASKPKGYSNYAAAIRQWLRKRDDITQKAKKDRKFAPSSDTSRAIANMNRMKENAL
jgi:hypothetical protein